MALIRKHGMANIPCLFNGSRLALRRKGLRFGAYRIYQGAQDEDLTPYEELHKELRRNCPKWNQAKDIVKIIGRFERLGADIAERLEKLAEMEHMCGRCALCSS